MCFCLSKKTYRNVFSYRSAWDNDKYKYYGRYIFLAPFSLVHIFHIKEKHRSSSYDKLDVLTSMIFQDGFSFPVPITRIPALNKPEFYRWTNYASRSRYSMGEWNWQTSIIIWNNKNTISAISDIFLNLFFVFYLKGTVDIKNQILLFLMDSFEN